MSINNLNPRRVIWFSPREPLNKYDIWLSKNAHYDENGEPTTDSNAQRDCDYIFKIYDCGKWNPIVGFNTTALNKINTVANADGYTYVHNGTTHFSLGITQFHLPLFREPLDSPAELFDAGTPGEAILEFVTESEWENIFNSEQFQDAWETNIENIDIRPAEANKLGGIYARRFEQDHNNDNYLAQCKYKYQSQHSRPDYNLFVHAKDVYEAISEYIDENDIDVTIENALFNIFENSASIMKGWHLLSQDAPALQVIANKPRFVIGGDPWAVVDNRGKFLKSKNNDGWYSIHGGDDYSVYNSCWEYVDIHDYIGGEDPTPSQYRVPVKGLYGINTTYRDFGDGTEGYALKLSGYDGSTSEGRYCRTKFHTIPSDDSNEGIPNEWEYTEVAGGSSHGLEWVTGPVIIKDATNYELTPETLYLHCTNGTLGWSLGSGGGDSYTAGFGIDFVQDTQNLDNFKIDLNIRELEREGDAINIWWNGDSSTYLNFTDDEASENPLYIYECLHVYSPKGFTIDLYSSKDYFNNPNPIYIYLHDTNTTNSIAENNHIVDTNVQLIDNSGSWYFGQNGGNFLITILFGTIKVEEIKQLTSS